MANKAYCEWIGISKDQIVGTSLRDVLDPVSFSLAKTNIDRALQGNEVSFELKVPHVSGQSRWVNATYIPDRGVNGEVSGFCAFIVDIEERKQEEFKRQTLMHAIDRGMEGFALHDHDGVFLYINSALAKMYGYSVEELHGKSWRQLYDSEQTEKIVTGCFPYLLEQGHWRGELIGFKKDKSRFDVEVSLTLTKNESNEMSTLFCACRDISEQKRSRKEVDFLAYHDPLTGLPNRTQFKEQLTKLLEYESQLKTNFAILFIDLDYFKHVNDTLGHSIGDQLLQQVAARLQTVFRFEDTVARLSGDEFTVLLNEVSGKRPVKVAINKLLEAFNAPFHIGGREIFQTISIGVSLYPEDGKDVESLMKNADAAMYQVKEEGRKNFCFYTPKLTDSAYENMLYRGQLQSALERNEFELHYQPIISLLEKRVCGLEALIRWRHSNGKLVYPDKFIHHAEQSNLILPIGLWVIETVCTQIQTWKTHGIEIDQVAVNVSGNQLHPGFSKDVSDILKRTGTTAQKLEFEVTETFFIKGLNQSIIELDGLRQLGISLAIDDFGVGYSSLSQLKQLPTQCLKIDRSFVGDIVDKSDDLAIVQGIIALGKSLNLQITAEGVETTKQHMLLAELGCQKTQGYFYAKPQPSSEIVKVCLEINEKLDAMYITNNR